MVEVIDVVSHLCVFLEEKFLAWLEVLSVLGTARIAVVALKEVIPWLQVFGWLQVFWNEELLDIARDYFHFVTKFFEPINVSATHIYHSTLELSPISSIVQRLYYHRRHTLFPRVVVGTADSWDQGICISNIPKDNPYTWSPCGQFVAVVSGEAVEIQDALSAEITSTLTTPNTLPNHGLTYSPDGRTLAGLSDTLTIWDVQTGGAVKGIQYNDFGDGSIVWLLDGKMIAIAKHSTRTAHIHNVVLSTT